jgi:hypothetical protein
MKRTKLHEALYGVYGSRVQASEALGTMVQGINAYESLSQAAAGLHQAAVTLGEGKVGLRYKQFARLLDIMGHLLRWAQAVRSAEEEADRHLRAARQLARDLAREVDSDPEAVRLSMVASTIGAVADVDEVEQIAELLLHTPLPLPLFAEASRPQWSGQGGIASRTVPEVSVAFVSFTLNDVPFGNPQTIEPGVLHDLTVEVRVSRWPDQAEELVLDVVAVEPPDVYQLPKFSFSRPEGTPPYVLSKTGRMLLRVPQALLSRPLEFTYRAWFMPEDGGAKVTVEGQRHLRVQSFDPERNPQTGYREVDRRMLDIRAQARAIPGVRDKELYDFIQILATLGRIAAQAHQDALFPGVWAERKFQDELKKFLRADPRIGSELEEHPKAAGGITDLSYRGIRIELKVVSDRLVTIEDARRFLGQTTQYVVGSDRRFGILCLLDCSPKAAHSDLVANDLVLQTVQPARGEAEMPVLVGVVIIRGNLPTPSSLSRSG